MSARAQVTRARILAAALKLLNERGVGRVNVRDVAGRAHMSHGNLCYHFANMGAVIDALYDELVAESDASLVGARSLEPSMRLFYDLQERTFDLMLKYRFLFLDFVAVVRGRKQLARRLRLLKGRRAREFAGFADWAAKHGLLARERYVGERELMFRQYDLMSDFWLSQAEILYSGDLGRVKHLYQRLTFSVIVPHLSRKGLTECKALGLLGSNRARRIVDLDAGVRR